ncbi:MAG: alpha/beta hydrolase [Nonomuraea sp.]|nr:alpha/beta hydrolase [Nonomuraea sp.]
MSYADVNGLSLHYEEHGEGEVPLILLHGGFGLGAMFEPLLPALTQGRRVVTVDLQGHGGTADVDRPLRAETLGDDVAALIEHLGVEQADVFGYSLGGFVAFQTAIRHPDRVRRLVVVSATLRRDGSYPEVLAAMQHINGQAAEHMKDSPMYEAYAAIAPRVEDWTTLGDKTGDLLRQDFDWIADAGKITAPVLLVFADADTARYEHVVEMLRAFGGAQGDPGWDGSGGRGTAQLAILPGHTHYDVWMSPLLPPTVNAFLS